MDFSIQFAMKKCTFTICFSPNDRTTQEERNKLERGRMTSCKICLGDGSRNAIPFVSKCLVGAFICCGPIQSVAVHIRTQTQTHTHTYTHAERKLESQRWMLCEHAKLKFMCKNTLYSMANKFSKFFN